MNILRTQWRKLVLAFKAPPPVPPDPDKRRRDLPRRVPPGAYDRFGRRYLTREDMYDQYLRAKGYDFKRDRPSG